MRKYQIDIKSVKKKKNGNMIKYYNIKYIITLHTCIHRKQKTKLYLWFNFVSKLVCL